MNRKEIIMYEELKGISIKGKCFENITNLNFFNNKNQKISLIFGRSGKSTISNGLYKYATNDTTTETQCRLVDFNNNIIVTTSTDNNNGSKNRIFIFNEHYINKNIGIKDDGLDTIVLFGQQNDVETQIEEQKAKLNQLSVELENLIQKRYDYITISNNIYNKIENILKEKDGWAERDSRIKGNKQNSAVKKEIIFKIAQINTNKNIDELLSEYQLKFIQYKDISSNKKYPNIQYNIPKITPEIENQLFELLKKKIDTPIELSQLEKKIFTQYQSGQREQIDLIHKNLKNGITECPYCHQKISQEYCHLLLQSIETVLNKEVEEHSNRLETLKNYLKNIQFNINPFYTLNSEICHEIDLKIKECNSITEEYLVYINNKIENIHIPILKQNLNLVGNIHELIELFNQLKEILNNYNNMFKETSKLKNDLININNSIAYHKIISYYNEYNNIANKINTFNDNIHQIEIKRQNIEDTISTLEQKKNNTQISIELINRGLQYIFFDNNRLYLEPYDGKYILKSKNRLVKPSNISCGERNILALCYYFTEILEKQDIKNLYNTEMLLLIDDPISSFDMENKIGIQSYLKQQLFNVLEGNKKSKIIILSHDISTILDLIKSSKEILSNIFNTCLNRNADLDKKLYIGLLENTNIVQKTSYYIENTFNEYTANIELIYNYATKNIDIHNNYIGNIMRRVLEAFSTFEYKKGIEEISTNNEIISTLGEKQDYFSNLMYRIVVNNLSHSKYQIQTCNLNFYSFLSEEEKIRTAKDILCLIYGLNKNHLKAHLKNINDAIKTVEEWYLKIPSFPKITL